jgi:protein-tyrosine phosphatase
MAVGLLRRRLASDELSDEVIVSSAGIYGLEGSPASAPGVEVLAERGIDISDHVARRISERELKEADLVLVMEEQQRRTLFHSYPQHLAKVFLLSEMSGDYGDVQDPYRRPKGEYALCADRLETLIDRGYETILRRLKLTRLVRP